MIFRVGLENNVEGRSQAWILGYPGCFAYGADEDKAMANTPKAIQEYTAWINIHNEGWLIMDKMEIHLDETWNVYAIDKDFDLAKDGYEVNAWFRHDWKPLSTEDVERGLKMLSWSRVDLLKTVENLSDEGLKHRFPDERWNINGILNHVGGAEWWYLDRLELAFPREKVPRKPLERLQEVRVRLVEVLPTLIGSSQVIGVDGEFWSPRKLLRRAVWHERDHTSHINKLKVMHLESSV